MNFKKPIIYSLLALSVVISVFGLQPLQQTIDAEKALVKQIGVHLMGLDCEKGLSRIISHFR